jgi:hypothetical protein
VNAEDAANNILVDLDGESQRDLLSYAGRKCQNSGFGGVDQQVRYSEVPTRCSWSALIANLPEPRT